MSLLPLGILSSSAVAAGAFELISTTVLASTAASVTFNLTSAQQSDYKHLQVRFAGQLSGNEFIVVQYNSDTTNSNYSSHLLEGTGSGVASYSSAGQGWILNGGGLGYYSGSYSNSFICDILDFSSTVKYKTSRTLGGHAASGNNNIKLASNVWKSTNAISSITFKTPTTPTFNSGSRFSLYGVKGS